MKFENKMHYLSDNSISIGSKTIKIEPIDDDNIASSSSTIASLSTSSPSGSHHSIDEYHGNHYHNNQHQQQQQQYHSSSLNQHNQNHHQHQQRQGYHQNHLQNSPKIIPKMNFYRQRQSESPPHQLENHQSQQQQQQRYASSKHHNIAREYHIDASQVEITRGGNSISIVNRSGNRCPRSPPPLNISSQNGGSAQIVITRAIQTPSNSGSVQSTSSAASSTSSSSSTSHHHVEHHQQQQINQNRQQQNHHHQHQQHPQQQVRVICDGRLYDEEARRRLISPSPPPSSSSSSSSSSSHHHLHAPDSNLRILSSVAAVAAEEEQAAAAARKHASNNNNSDSTTSIVTRHVNVISSNLKSIDNYNGTIQKSNINIASNNSSNSNNNCVNNNNNNSNTTIFRTPVVSSSSSNSINNGSNIKNSNSSGGGSNHINNSSNVMRPPPPPPPPKIKSTSALQSNQSGVSCGSSSLINSNNSEEPSSSIPDLEFDGTTVLCRVCGDKASGFHYGVHSCEGCKGFFRRSIQQKIQYRPCTKNQQCSILRINRNRCQYCRLKKCIAVGMSRDAVRFGRVPKREKARILAAMQQSTQNRGQQRQLATELDDQPRLLAAVLRAHMETCEFTKEKVAAMRQRARECPSYSMPTLLACPLNPAPELQSEQEFSERFAHVIRGVIDFAGMIPGFQLLNQDDKFTLLKAGLFDALFVRLICMFDSSINSIICLNGQVMRRDAIQNGANARFLVDSTFNFAERMNSMNLSDAEIGLFCAIVLITPDRPGLRNIELIDKMYSRLKGCLQTIINQNRPDQPDFMSELLKTLPDLRTLSTLHTEKLVVFRTEHKELLRQQMWQMEDDQPSKSPGSSGSNWDDRDRMIDELAKSPMGSVSSTESGDIGEYSPQHHHHHHHYHGHNHHHHGHQSSLASSAPLLAATLSGTCPLRHRANSGSSAEDIDVVVGSHAHLTQNGLTITPVARTHSTTASTHLLHHHLSNGGRYRKLDSPTDSGIESGNEKAESTKTVSSGGGSSCSSPRSSVDDALDAEAVAHVTNGHSTNSTAATTNNSAVQNNNNNNVGNGATKRQIVEDMPVLKRVLQAPPLYDTNSLMDEAYKPHKKFRALRHRDYDSSENDPHTTSTTGNTCNSNGSATSTTTPPIVQITPAGHSTSPSPNASQQSTTSSSSSPTTVPQNIPSPSPVSQQQSQLHMHLTRNLNTTTNNSTSNSNNLNSSNHNSSNNNYNHHNNSNLSTTTQSTSAAPALSPQIQTNQQQQHSSLSSTHSVLAKSLMAEPRMTPEQIKRSDIIQNYIMRGSSSSPNPNGLIVAPANNNSNPTSQSSHNHHHHHYQTSASPLLIGNAPTSPSTTTVTLSSPPPPSHQHQQQSSAQQQHTMRWQNQSVITTTTLRQQSVSPHSNSSSCSNGSTTNSSYFQSPHSTSVSPPRPSPSATHSPRLIELQVDIADSQQPLNLSKKSPTPPPPLSITTVSSIQQQQHVQKLPAALVAHKYPSVSPDVTVTAATPNCPQVTVSPAPSPAATTTIHKVLLEA